ncbi:hypothetical protein EGX47_02050 [Yersinia pseudotuberculosis]|uniref:Uncharacterized protein n=2 Tax=Yersinia pseudotuberculosis TaxID=633 RepID=A0ABM7ADE4_YERPU|nr:hypothetical protein EGX47_02050 [Yersinia pseudotuberculosis]
MDITKSQKEFEDKYPKGLIHGVARLSNGEYASEFTRRIFLAWQAGRESIEIELPTAINAGEIGPAISKERIMARLAYAGIRIKGESE